MNSLDRFKNTFKFQGVDRFAIHTMGGWTETYLRWMKEGLPENWEEINFFNEDKFGNTGVWLGVNSISPFFPRGKMQVIEENDEYTIFRDEHYRIAKHKKCEVNEGISEFLEFPVKDRYTWEAFKEKIDPLIEGRYALLEKTAKQHGGIGNRDYPIIQMISGTYRIMWHLMGDINLCYAFYDDPELIHDIMKHWLDLNVKAIDRIMQYIDINILQIHEDMAGKSGMMISPSIFREFMMPYYKELIKHVKKYPSIFGIWEDSDGDVTELIPLLLECGVQGMFPFEVQAGLDIVKIKEKYGDRLVIRGGIDKKELVNGKEAIDRELDRVLPIFTKTGGYVVSLDHQAPPDISLENYIYFLDKAREYK